MYDSDSDDSQKGFKQGVGKLAKGASGGVKKMARGTRRMSMAGTNLVKNMPGNVTSVAKNMPGNVIKVGTGTVHVAAGTVKGTVGAVGHVARGAEHIVTGKKPKKKKKKKKDKEKDKVDRGRSKSPRAREPAPTNAKTDKSSKPPVTKSLVSMFRPKNWRSASPAVGRGKKKSTDEPPQNITTALPPHAQSLQQPPPYGANGFDQSVLSNGGGYVGAPAGYNGSGGFGGGPPPPPVGGFNHDNGMQMQMHPQRVAQESHPGGLGASLRSMSSAQRNQRQRHQEKIEKENNVPVFTNLMQSKHFAGLCDKAFQMVDSNGDEAIDESELYAGLLLIHLKLGCFLGPAACRPMSRERCATMFHKFDSTGSGALDQTEFRRVITVLFANVLARVCIQFALTLFCIPYIAMGIKTFLTVDMDGFWEYWTKPKALRQMGEELTLDYYVDWNETDYPSPRRTFFSNIMRSLNFGSEEFWERFPLTFLTIILGLVIVPLIMYAVDDVFHLVADKKAKKVTGSRKSTRSSVR